MRRTKKGKANPKVTKPVRRSSGSTGIKVHTTPVSVAVKRGKDVKAKAGTRATLFIGDQTVGVEVQSIEFALKNPSVRRYAHGMTRMAHGFQEILKNPELITEYVTVVEGPTKRKKAESAIS